MSEYSPYVQNLEAYRKNSGPRLVRDHTYQKSAPENKVDLWRRFLEWSVCHGPNGRKSLNSPLTCIEVSRSTHRPKLWFIAGDRHGQLGTQRGRAERNDHFADGLLWVHCVLDAQRGPRVHRLLHSQRRRRQLVLPVDSCGYVLLVDCCGNVLTVVMMFYQLTVVMLEINSCINPLIYAAKYREFQHGIRRLTSKSETDSTPV